MEELQGRMDMDPVDPPSDPSSSESDSDLSDPPSDSEDESSDDSDTNTSDSSVEYSVGDTNSTKKRKRKRHAKLKRKDKKRRRKDKQRARKKKQVTKRRKYLDNQRAKHLKSREKDRRRRTVEKERRAREKIRLLANEKIASARMLANERSMRQNHREAQATSAKIATSMHNTAKALADNITNQAMLQTSAMKAQESTIKEREEKARDKSATKTMTDLQLMVMKLGFAPVSALTQSPPLNTLDLKFTELHEKLIRRTGSVVLNNQLLNLTTGWECRIDLGSVGQFLSIDGFAPPAKDAFGGFTIFMFNPTTHNPTEEEMMGRLESLVQDPKSLGKEWGTILKRFKYYFPKTVDEMDHMITAAVDLLCLLSGNNKSIAAKGYIDAAVAVKAHRLDFKHQQVKDPAFLTKVLYLIEVEQQRVYQQLEATYLAEPIFPLVRLQHLVTQRSITFNSLMPMLCGPIQYTVLLPAILSTRLAGTKAPAAAKSQKKKAASPAPTEKSRGYKSWWKTKPVNDSVNWSIPSGKSYSDYFNDSDKGRANTAKIENLQFGHHKDEANPCPLCPTYMAEGTCDPKCHNAHIYPPSRVGTPNSTTNFACIGTSSLVGDRKCSTSSQAGDPKDSASPSVGDRKDSALPSVGDRKDSAPPSVGDPKDTTSSLVRDPKDSPAQLTPSGIASGGVFTPPTAPQRRNLRRIIARDKADDTLFRKYLPANISTIFDPPCVSVDKDNFVPPPWLHESVEQIAGESMRPPASPPFKFAATDHARAYNTELLIDHDHDLSKILEANQHTTVAYGSEFWELSDLEAVFGRHPNFDFFSEILTNGMDYHFDFDLTEDERMAELEANLERGNHNSAKDDEEVLIKMAYKEVKHGFMVPVSVEIVKEIKNAMIQAVGIVSQWTINAKGERVVKKRLTHDLSYWITQSYASVNSRCNLDKYPPMIYGWCLIRIIHYIVALRAAFPDKRILISKYDFSDAYRRIAHAAQAAAQTIFVIGQVAFICLRLSFGGSVNPPSWCSVSEMITDLSNELPLIPKWNPDKLFSPAQVQVPAPRYLDDSIPLALARPLVVDIPTTARGRGDCFVDDIIKVYLDDPVQIQRHAASAPLAIHIAMRPNAGTSEPVDRRETLSVTKLEAEGTPQEIHTVLGWELETRRLICALPEDKYVAWLSKEELEDLALWLAFLAQARAGISMNGLTIRNPTILSISDSCPYGLGGFTSGGRAWRLKISKSSFIYGKSIATSPQKSSPSRRKAWKCSSCLCCDIRRTQREARKDLEKVARFPGILSHWNRLLSWSW
ncbi:hypothetical protein FRACYDRAFT_245162 [Fragilariopsis cylindrus CCMP1102]|uniref:Uncharacterized protein n=1 Tax=Fragilariopsis cylindrus CCMP1102 TaxID=635003 RepID=A0A1E7F1X5_9STRA|nr:hypothetical protein FRACYDRAFT_245162 [Fragilariopsis cylindrus CCMP1102]|eukprot:OEU12035.1 hypothetical protein FRACYDRAFT_245162 [Fragilariopsis cylindrus CCMP1102]